MAYSASCWDAASPCRGLFQNSDRLAVHYPLHIVPSTKSGIAVMYRVTRKLIIGAYVEMGQCPCIAL